MAKYTFVYTGGPKMGEQTQEEQQAQMGEWMSWFGSLGDAVVDMGNPLPVSRTVTVGGVTDTGASGLTGITTVTAGNIDAAVEMAKGCPVIAAGGAVEVYEAMEM
jgi:hypothetical protein